MHGDDQFSGRALRHGPFLWAVSALAGAAAGWLLTLAFPATYAEGALSPRIPIPLVIPFALLLGSIAIMPLAANRWWHRHFPDVAFFLGFLVGAYYLLGFTRAGYEGSHTYGQSKLLHTALEYYSFIALVGGLYVVSGGILVHVRARGGPITNTLLLLSGAVLANVVGTTGASVLLIRPFLRMNDGRIRPLHVVFFIFIVSNCGGALTPIGDPPLYLGYLKGVPFLWPLQNMWYNWALVNGVLLAMFAVYDGVIGRRLVLRPESAVTVSPAAIMTAATLSHGGLVRGAAGLCLLPVVVGAVFLDQAIHHFVPGAPHLPYGATAQILLAALAYKLAPRDILSANEFSFFPVKEVGLLFIGIFLTMMPALGFLSANGSRLGLDTPTTYYFGAGGLSAVLDNAPTYLNFLQVAMAPNEITKEGIHALIATPVGRVMLDAISCGAVFFGAMSYIGNGPNFMVRSIAEAAEIKMPSFFAYVGWACVLLLPVLVLNWAVFIR